MDKLTAIVSWFGGQEGRLIIVFAAGTALLLAHSIDQSAWLIVVGMFTSAGAIAHGANKYADVKAMAATAQVATAAGQTIEPTPGAEPKIAAAQPPG